MTVTTPVEKPSGSTNLERFAWLSIAAALATIGLKVGAYLLTGSVGLLSDAAESCVNLVAALIALSALRVAARPADDNHHFGHGKAEYFSAGAEGLMIFVAAGAILVTAVQRLMHPQPLEQLGAGLAISVVASVINGVVGMILLRAGAKYRSSALSADGHHLLTDVWTSVGVIVGVGLVALTNWQPLDSIVAILVGLNILRVGYRLIRDSVVALLDAALPEEDQAQLDAVLAACRTTDVDFTDVRSRVSGRHRFISLTVLVPGDWSVEQAHDVAVGVEGAIAAELVDSEVQTHIAPRVTSSSAPNPAEPTSDHASAIG